MKEGRAAGTGWRRLRGWQWLAIAVVAAGLAAVVAGLLSSDEPSDGLRACQAVVQAVRGTNDGSGSAESLLEVVRRQVPVARAAASEDASYQPVADAMEEMQGNLEAGRPWPSVVVLYQRCG